MWLIGLLSHGLGTLVEVAAFADRFGLLAGFAEVAIHQSIVVLPPATIFGVLYT